MEPFGRYHLAESLGVADAAEVYRAYSVAGSIVRPVRLKREVLHPPPRAVEEEASLVSRLAHPNVESFVDAGEQSGYTFLALAWVPGRPLSALIEAARARNLSFDLHAALYVMIQALQGLAHAHEQSDGRGGLLGIVHRDLGPHAIQIGYAGQVMVGSFGYAQYRGRTTPTPAPGHSEPRYHYASPELASGDSIDHRSDIYSAGLLLYELLAGRPAYEFRSTLEARARAQKGGAPALQNLAPHLPSDVVQVVERAMVLDRNMRHPSAQVFRDELQRLLYTREPTYGPHRLASLTALLLGEEAAEDQRRDHEARALLAAAKPLPNLPSLPNTSRTPAFGAPAPAAATPAFGAPVPASSPQLPGYPVQDPALAPTYIRAAATPPPTLDPRPTPLERSDSDRKAHYDAFSSEHELPAPEIPDSMPFHPQTGELDGLVVGGSGGAPTPGPGPSFAASAVAVADDPRPAAPAYVPSSLEPSGPPVSGPAFEEKKSPVGKIVAAVVALAVIGVLAFTFSSERNTRLVSRKLKAAVMGRKAGGALTVESIPPGASLFVDDEDTGRKTPVTIDNLESEVVHHLALELPGEPTETSTVSILAGQKKTVNVLFRNAVVDLSVKTDPPGADFYLDGRSIALTPTSLSLRTGKEVTIKITKLGYLPVEQKVVPEPQKPVKLDLVLEKSEEMKAAEAAEAEAIKAAEEEASGKGKKKKR
ncbi:MAG: serine/threonine protein kinase [Deltaproteobacteria bacterium]|nr:serine/threonine protein kinase [Deltaproteobacteria bacterium]